MRTRRPARIRALPWLVVAAVAVLATALAVLPGRVAAGPRASSASPAPAGPSTSAPSTPGTRAAGHAVLALGDSVPAGHACGCAPFPQTYGSMLSTRTGVPVSVDNRAVSGLDTAGLLAQLSEPATVAAVRRSDVVVLTIGANDFGDHHDDVVTGRCEAGDADCVADELAVLRTNLARILATLHDLRDGRSTTILVTDYWNVFQDGDVARRAVGAAGLQASLDLTRRANRVIGAVSGAAHARFVDLFAPFEQEGRDVTALMAADGDHPNAAGHALIAHELVAAGLAG